MYYHIKLVSNHFVKITDVIEIISVTPEGRYDYRCHNSELECHVFRCSDELKPIEQSLYDYQEKAWANYRKANKPELLGDAVPELIEANCMCGRNNLCDDCKNAH